MTEHISLGGRDFELRPLKLGQLRNLLDALDEMTGKSGSDLIDSAAKVFAIGISSAHPELTVDDVLNLEATIAELNAAVAAVLKIAGLQSMGEMPPVAIPELSSAPSTALSPPAAATITEKSIN